VNFVNFSLIKVRLAGVIDSEILSMSLCWSRELSDLVARYFDVRCPPPGGIYKTFAQWRPRYLSSAQTSVSKSEVC